MDIDTSLFIPIGIILATGTLIVTGLAMAGGGIIGQENAEKMKRALPGVFGGLILLVIAGAILGAFQGLG
jgi:hypothetical protein